MPSAHTRLLEHSILFIFQVYEQDSEIESLQRNLNDSRKHFEIETSKISNEIQDKEREIDRLQRQVHEQNESLNNR